ncbi:SDR family oxidoreductase [Frankia sp. Ag45/Mut15]|uniref:SDR family oxidoreductase n=1 Tax=Frankia umida TaxID=573489 RepID=A0ABT0K2A1_9ACTN|nr:SDR family oxidoreductase [Frankia umida]MCK9877905.1 SDR family oxidoreductase [Frankia umida]
MRPVELADKVAVITGAGSGLGAALARVFAEAGMAVAALDIDPATAEQTADEIAARFGVPTTAARVDVGDPKAITDAAAHVEATLGGCDVLCANVGVQQFGALDRLTDQDWEWVLSVNVLGTVRTVRSFLPLIRARGGWRRIMVTASSSVLVPGVRLGAYITSKFAVQGYAETLRAELAAEGIGVSVLFPAGMTTRHLETSASARPAERGAWTMLPDDIEVMLASRGTDEASHVVTPDHAVRNVIQELQADNPYIITHGTYRERYQLRTAAMDAAFDRLEQA